MSDAARRAGFDQQNADHYRFHTPGAPRSDPHAREQARYRSDSENRLGLLPHSADRPEVQKAHAAYRVLPPGRDVSLPQADRVLVPNDRRTFRPRSLDRDSRLQPDPAPDEQRAAVSALDRENRARAQSRSRECSMMMFSLCATVHGRGITSSDD